MKVLRILLLEDSLLDAELIHANLSDAGIDCELVRVETRADFVTALQKGSFDLILADYALPSFDGISALEIARTTCPELPFIFVSATLGEELAIETLKNGATDYVLKQRLWRLAPSVHRALREAKERNERVQAETALRDALQKLTFHVENSPLAVIEWNREFHVSWWSKEAERLFGWCATEVIGKHPHDWQFVFPEDVEVVNSIIDLFTAGKEKSNIAHNRNYTKNGSVIHCEWYNSVLIDESGNLVSVLSLVLDVTERKRAESERYRSEQEFKALAENSPDIIARFDRELRHVYVNPVVEKATGIPRETFIGKTNAELGFSDEINACWQERLQHIFETGRESSLEFDFPSPSGIRYYQSRVVPEFALDGSVESLLSITRDLTEYKLAESALRKSEARFRSVFESKMIAMGFWDKNGYVTDVNDAFLELIGYTRSDFIANKLHWKDITPPEYISGDRENCKDSSDFSLWGNYEKEYIRKDGSRIPILLGGVSFEDTLSGGVFFALDLTERKKLENRLRQQAEELGQANRIKDEFLAVLSHELRSPLNPILGWAKLLRTRKFDEETTARAIETIERNAKVQTQLIEDLLDVSRIMQGKISLNKSRVSLKSTIEAAIETVSLAAEAKSIQIQRAIDPNLGLVSGDPSRLQQVVWNLLSNAIKFTSEGGRVEIRLSTNFGFSTADFGLEDTALESNSVASQELPTNPKSQIPNPKSRYAQLTVSDTGKGIRSDFLPYVFDYFRQADSSTTRKHGGLGLGLAIVRRLVELHGGTVCAESPGEGLGATFTVKLPLLKETIEPRTDSPLPSPHSWASTPLKDLRVLVVDDDTDSREFLSFVLEQYGAQVTAVASASEGFEALCRLKPDVLVSDIGMPQEDGYSLIGKVRALDANEGGQTPAIALTAYARDEDHKQALSAGFQMHMAKPVEPGELAKVLARLAACTEKV
ncbi:PAS domain S-box protein [Argonema galeatum]|uniref:PAS domain S-box protein n=1 Tax=Argonema galeatum TaxID=2942762 RepID=UPI002012ADCB|nr:PAS domain S-box protein [Argonema galeatum A003/A1]